MTDQMLPGLRVVFWLLAVGVVFLPMRWAVFSLVLISNFDITAATFDSATSVGFENAFRTVVLPTVLMFRFTQVRFSVLRSNVLLALWAALTVYAALACLWTPYQLSGVKMVGYMYCYVALGAVFQKGWDNGSITPGLIAGGLWASLVMGAVQTFLLGNPYGKSLPGLHDDRFTSFCTPQLYAAFLLATLSILLVTSRIPFWKVCVHGFAGLCGIVLCGSRYVFIGSTALIAIACCSHVVRQPTERRRAAMMLAGASGLLILSAIFAAFLYLDPDNRISQLATMVAEGKSPLDNIGTLVWRRGIYDQALNGLSQRGPLELAFGSGTSSGANVVIGWDLRYTEDRVDANRVVHNELLRVLYEWGVIGFAIFAAFMLYLARSFIHLAISRRIIPAYAFLSLLPTVILGCFSENLLAGSASPAGVGILLSITYGISYSKRSKPAASRLGSRAPVACSSHAA